LKETLLEIKELETQFFIYDGVVKALNKIDLVIHKEETLGIVGETGCGKSVTALSILRLIAPPGRIMGGEILLEGEDLLKKKAEEMRKIRGRRISMIFQNPTSSLNPVFTVGDQLMAVIRNHTRMDKQEARNRAINMFKQVGLPDPEKTLHKHSYELSGGMQQRIMIAIALSCEPSLLIADEPTTALDVTIQAQILRLMKGLKDKLGTSILLITHNLGIVVKVCDRIVIMYAGEFVEEAPVKEMFENPRHPYSRGLLASIPKIGQVRGTEQLGMIKGTVCSLIDPPPGCRFHQRCSFSKDVCRSERPQRVKVGEDHFVFCHLCQ
jgi:oligopeptide/dipeptide ABC transporter ATP-binding protein